jgi:hypothetical protein
MAYTAITSRKVFAGTQRVSTYGAQADGRTYYPGLSTGINKWFTDVASSSNMEILELYLTSGQSSTMYSDYMLSPSAQSGPRIIRPAGTPGEASWQGHNGTPIVGVGLSTAGTSNAFAGIYFESMTNIGIYDLIIDGPSAKRAFYFFPSAAGEIRIIGNIIRRTGTTPTGPIQNGIDGSLSGATNVKVVNNIIVGFWDGVAGVLQTTSNVIYSNTIINTLHAPIWYTASGNPAIDNRSYCYNNAYYGFGVAAEYYPGRSGNNVVLSSTSNFVDYANQDYRLATTASGAVGAGTDLSANAYYAFDDDIQNELRSTWDIGADKYSLNIINMDFNFARNIQGFMDVIAARDIQGFMDLSFSRNIGDVFTEVTFTFNRHMSGFLDIEFARDIPGFIDFTFSRHIYGAVVGYSNFTPYFRDNIFKTVFGITSYNLPDLYLGLSTADPLADGSGIVEP